MSATLRHLSSVSPRDQATALGPRASGKVSVAGGVEVREKPFQFLIRLENPVLRHMLDRLDWPDALALHLLIDGLRAGFRRLSLIASAIRSPPAS
jgi:hypothetical protein